MINEDIQTELLLHYYDLWIEHPFRNSARLVEINKKFEPPLDPKVLEANAQYVIEKVLLEPARTGGFHTNITLKGVLFIESIRFSADVSLRTEILRKIKEKYDENPADYVNVHKLQEELSLTWIQMQRNVHMLEYLGLTKNRTVLGGINDAKITAHGIDYLNQPSIIDYETPIMSSAYSNLYRLENILRTFLERTLREEYGEKWWKLGVPSGVRDKAIENKVKDGGSLSNIHYTNFVHLKNVIQFEGNWKKIYEAVFKSQTGIISRLEELEPIRHKIAHTRMLTNDEIIKLELFYREISGMIQIS